MLSPNLTNTLAHPRDVGAARTECEVLPDVRDLGEHIKVNHECPGEGSRAKRESEIESQKHIKDIFQSVH